MICKFDKQGTNGVLIFQQVRGIRRLSSVRLPDTFGGRTKGRWCWIFEFTIFGFEKESILDSDDMSDILSQGIAIDDDNDPYC